MSALDQLLDVERGLLVGRDDLGDGRRSAAGSAGGAGGGVSRQFAGM